MLHTRTEEATIVAPVTPNGKTTAILEQTGFVHLLALYQHCCRHNLKQIGSSKFKPALANSVIHIHRAMANAGISEVGPRHAPATGVCFHFGGQMKAGQCLGASAYIEALARHVQDLHEPERQALEAIATAVFWQLTHMRLGT